MGGPGGRGLVRSDTVEERGSWDEKKISSNGGAEVEYAIVIAGRSSDEHIFKHLLDSARRTAVADKVGAELTVAGAAEGHVVPQNFDFLAVLFDDGERVVRGGGLDGIVEFDIGELRAADDFSWTSVGSLFHPSRL